MRILEPCVILKKERRKKKKREKKIHAEVELYVKSDTACSKSGALVCNRVSAVVQKLFPAICLRGWKTSPRRCILEPASPPLRRETFLI